MNVSKAFGNLTLQVAWFKVPTSSWPGGGLGQVTDKTKKTRRFCKSCNRALKLTFFILKTMCDTGGLSSRYEELFCERSAPEPWRSYRRHLLLHNDRISLRQTWLSLPFTLRVFPLQVLASSCLPQQILNTSPHSLRWAQEFIFIEICMEPLCWCPPKRAPTWRPETSRNICHWVLLQKREFIPLRTHKRNNNTLF